MAYNERLTELREQAERKRHLDNILADLRRQERELTDKVSRLEARKNSEQADVDQLQGRSLSVFFLRISGRLDEKLTREQQEACEAAVRYDAAVQELEAVREDILRYGREAFSIRNSQADYDALLTEKAQAIRDSALPEGEELIRLDGEQARLKSRLKEIREAIDAGGKAVSVTDSILSELDQAEGFGTWDMVGGGMLADMAKHSHLDNAQTGTERLQVALRRFRNELTDVQIDAEMQVNIDGFLRFADYFFDGLFADWAVMQRITGAKERVRSVRSQICGVMKKLEDMERELDREAYAVGRRRNELILRVPI
ncbi:MAG: hypothetical protein IKM31_00285 [Oscillospiraceae bacterium]|nr:hypothetical protein [Oscillospiraceae bacterium]